MNFRESVMVCCFIASSPGVVFLQGIREKEKALAIKFSNISLIKEAGIKKSNAKEVLFYLNLLLIILLVTALADPHIPLKQTKEGVNVVMVMDVSGSMAASDYKPTRLEAAKESAKTLVNELNNKDNSGL